MNCFKLIVFFLEPNWVGAMDNGILKEILYTNCWYKLDFFNCSNLVNYTVTTPIYGILSLNCHLHLFILTHIPLSWYHYLNGYNARWVQYCGSSSLINNFISLSLTLCAVLNQWNLKVGNTLQHRQRSILMVWNINRRLFSVLGKSVISQIISGGKNKRFPRITFSKSTCLKIN